MLRWAPEECNPDELMETGVPKGAGAEAGGLGGGDTHAAPRSGDVGDDASGDYHGANPGDSFPLRVGGFHDQCDVLTMKSSLYEYVAVTRTWWTMLFIPWLRRR